jgi:hypothetical protein
MARKLKPLIDYLLSRKQEIIFNVNDSIAGFVSRNMALFDDFSPELRPGTRYSVGREVLWALREEADSLVRDHFTRRGAPKQTGKEYQFSIIYVNNNGRNELHIQPIDDHDGRTLVIKITNMNLQILNMFFNHDIDKQSGQVQFKNTLRKRDTE